MTSHVPSLRTGVRSRAITVALGAGLVAIAPLRGAQAEHDMESHQHSMKTVERSGEHLSIEVDPDRKEIAIVIGPIDLPAGTTHHALEQLPVQEGTVPFDLTIRGYRAEIVDGEGRPVPQDVLHHMNLLDPDRRELFMPIMLRVLAASHETRPVSLPGWLFGIPMRGGARFLALAMLHNPTSETYTGVRVRLVIEYERRERLPLYTIIPWHLDTMFPVAGTKSFDLPPGASSKSFEASPVVSGLILGLGGHLHQYATRLTLRDLTTDDILYDVEPDVNDDGHIEKIPMLLHRGKGPGLLVEPSHVYRVTAEYWNPTGELIPGGGMGAVAGAFVPLDEWPSADPGNPLYVADYEWVLASQEHHEAGMDARDPPPSRSGNRRR